MSLGGVGAGRCPAVGLGARWRGLVLGGWPGGALAWTGAWRLACRRVGVDWC